MSPTETTANIWSFRLCLVIHSEYAQTQSAPVSASVNFSPRPVFGNQLWVCSKCLEWMTKQGLALTQPCYLCILQDVASQALKQVVISTSYVVTTCSLKHSCVRFKGAYNTRKGTDHATKWSMHAHTYECMSFVHYESSICHMIKTGH